MAAGLNSAFFFCGWQVNPLVRCGYAIVRSSEELRPVFGSLVCESSLMIAKLLLFSRSTLTFPRVDAWSSAVWENQTLQCALKSQHHGSLVMLKGFGGTLVESRKMMVYRC